MNIAIIGANSFIGKSIYDDLSQHFNVDLLGRNFYSYPEKNFQNSFSFDDLLKYDAIIHTVASGVQSKGTHNPLEIMSVNLAEPVALIEGLELCKYDGKLITFGSYFELGESWNGSHRIKEDELGQNVSQSSNPYILSKSMLTYYLNRKPAILNHNHLVLTNVYGPLENPNRLIPYIINGALRGQILKFSSGEQCRQFTFISDVSRVVSAVLNSSKPGIYNVTNPSVVQVKDVIQMTLDFVEKNIGKKTNYVFDSVNKRDQSMGFLALDNGKFEREFGVLKYISVGESLSSYDFLFKNYENR